MSLTIRDIAYLAWSIVALAACSGIAQEAIEHGDGLPAEAYIYWSDADSGHIRGIAQPIHFRLHDVDAPETRSPNQRGGAMCEAERPLGYAAKEFAVELTRDARIEITADYGEDQYDRLVIDLSVNGQDMATALIASGHGQIWDYDGGQDKPKWCQ
ncbi:MAG: thermonuclease family protein [Hyphomonadaceae bacterium]